MTKIFNGRYTTKTDQSFVIFLIGMRINQWWRFDKWFPVFSVMVRTMQRLFANPVSGFLHSEFYWNFKGPVLIQYWRSFDVLERFARQPADPHLDAWKKFNQAVGEDGSVGIWHETYTVNPDQFETFYGNMPRFGLAVPLEHVQAVGLHETARLRLGVNKIAELTADTK